MEEWNPYAPPKAEVGTVKNGNCVRDGKLVVIQAGSDFPPRCIVCNAPAAVPIKEIKLYWHSPWLYLLILINVLVYLVVGLLARKSVKVSPGLCATHSTKRKRRIIMFVSGGGAAVTAAIFLMMADESGGAIVLFLLALLMLVAGIVESK